MRLLEKLRRAANDGIRRNPTDFGPFDRFRDALKKVERIYRGTGLVVCSLYLSADEWDLWIEGHARIGGVPNMQELNVLRL